MTNEFLQFPQSVEYFFLRRHVRDSWLIHPGIFVKSARVET
jgi:hypothetical protein